jgi:acetyl-CoA acetyltransferase
VSSGSLRGKSAIVGVGLAGLGDAGGRSHLEILGEAVTRALADAGVGLHEVDGLFTANSVNFLPVLSVAEYLGVRPRWVDGTNIGGSSFLQHVIAATAALDAGLCDVALVCYGSNQRSAKRAANFSDPPPYEIAYQPRYMVGPFALAAARHMHEYGTTVEHLAEVAVAARAWARLNPDAFMREPLDIAGVRASRMVCDPLTVRDCCLMTDGGGALVLVRAERARDFPRPPVYFLGGGAGISHRQISSMPDLTVTAAVESGRRAFAMAGLGTADVDVVGIYDAFTINTLLALEDLGFCAKGEAGPFVAGGRIAPGGALPVNTNGGGLSCVHPGMYGIFLLAEAATQLRGAAGARQVPDVRVALAHGNGGTLSSQVTVLLGTEAAL